MAGNTQLVRLTDQDGNTVFTRARLATLSNDELLARMGFDPAAVHEHHHRRRARRG